MSQDTPPGGATRRPASATTLARLAVWEQDRLIQGTVAGGGQLPCPLLLVGPGGLCGSCRGSLWGNSDMGTVHNNSPSSRSLLSTYYVLGHLGPCCYLCQLTRGTWARLSDTSVANDGNPIPSRIERAMVGKGPGAPSTA